jgi:RNA polymerase sigma-32 factor
MERRLSARDLSFDPAPDADDEDGIASPSLYLPSREIDPATQVENAEWDDVVAASLTSALGKLDERSRAVVRSRWLAEEKRTLQELADEYGVSAERIRQIESAAIKKLRGAMTAA